MMVETFLYAVYCCILLNDLILQDRMVSGLFWLLLELASVTKMPQSMWESLSATLKSSPVSQRHPVIVN